MIAIDSSVLIDLLGDDERAPAAEACLRNALSSGPVAVCDDISCWSQNRRAVTVLKGGQS